MHAFRDETDRKKNKFKVLTKEEKKKGKSAIKIGACNLISYYSLESRRTSANDQFLMYEQLSSVLMTHNKPLSRELNCSNQTLTWNDINIRICAQSK